MKQRFSSIICFLLCLVLLFSSVPGGINPAKADENTDNRTRVIVSMGDSFSAGEGIPDFYGQNLSKDKKLESQDWLAHRSTKSWGGLLTLPEGKKNIPMTKDKNWFFVAASGAVTTDIEFRQSVTYIRDGYDTTRSLDPQIAVFDEIKDKKVEYVTITIGGNDVEFSNIITEASLGGYLVKGTLPQKLKQVWDKFYNGGIRENIKDTYWKIYRKAIENNPDAKIIVAGYPTLVAQNGKGAHFTKEDARLLTEAVHNFNKELQMIVNSCKAEGMKICFVSVEDAFNNKEAYSDKEETELLNRIILDKKIKEKYDLNTTNTASTFSIHPNEEGAKKYAECVQKKINQIEKDGGKSEWPEMFGSEERDVVLVLDASGSMSGTPLDETKKASEKFVETVLQEDASIGVVTYDNSALTIAGFSQHESFLKSCIGNINSGGGTNIEAGLAKAEEMLSRSNAKKKIIVLMSDGEPNEGKVGEQLISYATTLKEEEIYIYTLGFFGEISSKTEAQSLMERIASPGCHYEVDDAENLIFFFNDIADQIQGKKYIYIRIACPVDVTVEKDGEKLSSKEASLNQRTDFGSLTFEENPEQEESSSDNRIKILRLKDGEKYDINIEGNGNGRMTYTIGFMDENGEYEDLREFKNIRINKRTEISTVAANAKATTLKVDEDGDGKIDHIYRAKEKEKGELLDCRNTIYIILSPVFLLILMVIVLIIKKRLSAKKK